jgi:hypothetical protein
VCFSFPPQGTPCNEPKLGVVKSRIVRRTFHWQLLKRWLSLQGYLTAGFSHKVSLRTQILKSFTPVIESRLNFRPILLNFRRTTRIRWLTELYCDLHLVLIELLVLFSIMSGFSNVIDHGIPSHGRGRCIQFAFVFRVIWMYQACWEACERQDSSVQSSPVASPPVNCRTPTEALWACLRPNWALIVIWHFDPDYSVNWTWKSKTSQSLSDRPDQIYLSGLPDSEWLAQF